MNPCEYVPYMRRELERAREEASGASAYGLALYYFVTGNYSLMIVLTGFGLIGFGALLVDGALAAGPLSALEHGVFAGMFGVWGASLVVIGVAAYSVMLANKLYAQYTTDTGDEENDVETDVDTDVSL